MRRISDEIRAKIVHEYVSGKKIALIASIYVIAYPTVKKIIRASGIDYPPKDLNPKRQCSFGNPKREVKA